MMATRHGFPSVEPATTVLSVYDPLGMKLSKDDEELLDMFDATLKEK